MNYYDELIQKLRNMAKITHQKPQSALYNEAAKAIETLKIFTEFQGTFVKEIRPNKQVKVTI